MVNSLINQRGLASMIKCLSQGGVEDVAVLDAFQKTPRHLFVDPAVQDSAYRDITLPIGYQQTISQPSLVGKMLQTVREGKRFNRVLEIGAGSGFQTALLSHLANRVFAIERIKDLVEIALGRFSSLGLDNIHLKHADGLLGWPEEGAFDAIVMGAYSSELSLGLLSQLTNGGRFIAPVGSAYDQDLVLVKRENNKFVRQKIAKVKFVPALSGIR